MIMGGLDGSLCQRSDLAWAPGLQLCHTCVQLGCKLPVMCSPPLFQLVLGAPSFLHAIKGTASGFADVPACLPACPVLLLSSSSGLHSYKASGNTVVACLKFPPL